VRARRSSVGFDFVHCAVDDHSRLAYGEIHAAGGLGRHRLLREAAARAVQAGTATAKSGDGAVEMIRALRGARRSAMKARTQAVNQLKALIVTAPDVLREHIRGVPGLLLNALGLATTSSSPVWVPSPGVDATRR
jgi:hypothetical protein